MKSGKGTGKARAVVRARPIDPRWPTEAISTCPRCKTAKIEYQFHYGLQHVGAMTTEKAWEVHLSSCNGTPPVYIPVGTITAPFTSPLLVTPSPSAATEKKNEPKPPSSPKGPKPRAISPLVPAASAAPAVPVAVPIPIPQPITPDAHPLPSPDAHPVALGPVATKGEKRKSPEPLASGVAGVTPVVKKQRTTLWFSLEGDQKRLEEAEQTTRELLTKAEGEEADLVRQLEQVTTKLDSKRRVVARLKVAIQSLGDS